MAKYKKTYHQVSIIINIYVRSKINTSKLVFIVDSRPLGRESEINLLETLQVSNRFIVAMFDQRSNITEITQTLFGLL